MVMEPNKKNWDPRLYRGNRTFKLMNTSKLIVLLFLSFFLISEAAPIRSKKKHNNNRKAKGKCKDKGKTKDKIDTADHSEHQTLYESALPFCTSHFELMERYHRPYPQLQPSDPSNLLKNATAYHKSLANLNMGRIDNFAMNSAYIRDAFMPLLSKALKSSGPKGQITTTMQKLSEFIGKTELCHEFWKVQMDLYRKSKTELAHHLFNEYDKISRNVTAEKISPQMEKLMQESVHSSLNDYRKVREQIDLSKELEKDLEVQPSLEESLDYCARQLMIMQSAMRRYMQLFSEIDDPRHWPKLITHCASISTDIYILNFWMRKLVKIRSETDQSQRYILLGKLVSVMLAKISSLSPDFSGVDGAEKMEDLWLYLNISIIKSRSEKFSDPHHRSILDNMAVYALAEFKILRSLWNHLRYPYDKGNFFKVIFNYEGFEPVFRITQLKSKICSHFTKILLTTQLTRRSFQEYISIISFELPIEGGDKLCTTMKECRPLNDAEWDVLVTPMKQPELNPKQESIIDLSKVEIFEDELPRSGESEKSSDSSNTSEDKVSQINDSPAPKDLECSENQEISHDAETVEEENARLMKEHQERIDYYNRLRKVEGRELVRKRKDARLLSVNSTCTTTTEPVILLNRLGDFLALFPEAARVHEVNKKNRTVVKALNRRDKKQRFRWALDPSVVIDFETYKFLAAVFVPAYSARKTLNFNNFEACVRALGGTVSGTVYVFPRRLEVDGQTYICPPGEVHPEHKSSDVNHKSMSIFLEYAGFHINLFEPID